MKRKKFKIKYKNMFIFLIGLCFAFLLSFYVFNMKIKNIYVSGNYYLTDQEIIEISKLENYPRAFFNSSINIKKRLISNQFIENVKVNKKFFARVYIDIVENRPLFYNSSNGKVILKNGDEISGQYNVPILTNHISSSLYNKFLEKFSLIDLSIIDGISEITYTPCDVDKELFLFTMNDGNYVSVNLDRFDALNRYFDMVVKFNNHNGILYLDSGEYFKILDN